jgi:hypothetical protein
VAPDTDHLKVELSTEGWRLSEHVERCCCWSTFVSAPGDTAAGESVPPETESLFGVLGPPIFESRFLSYALDEL